MQALGFTHADLGGLLVDKWNFPEELVNSIRYHRAPEESPSKSVLISVVHMAKTIALASKFGVECEKLEYPVLDFALKAVNITKEKYETLKEEAIAYIDEKAAEFVDIAS
jgi:HD-like signal output (HDOD) protein